MPITPHVGIVTTSSKNLLATRAGYAAQLMAAYFEYAYAKRNTTDPSQGPRVQRSIGPGLRNLTALLRISQKCTAKKEYLQFRWAGVDRI